MLSESSKFIVCQIGARENYSIARSLHRDEKLQAMITDIWAPKSTLIRQLSPRIAERCHDDLMTADIYAPNTLSAIYSVRDRMIGRQGWCQIGHRNRWFQSYAAKQLDKIWSPETKFVFSYSYAAQEIFRYAKRRGATTILGQIDPGPVEARLVKELYSDVGEPHEPPPPSYWQNWAAEIELSDIVIVNSVWSKRCLVEEGVPTHKINVLPLAYETLPKRSQNLWSQPTAFSIQRPLRLLFLGQVNRRKGADLVLDMMRQLPTLPIVVDIVGPEQFQIPEAARLDPRIHFHGSVKRSEVQTYYDNADLFLFPTRSDGFGLTQLEAVAAGVPILASKYCGDVVVDGANGRIVEPLNTRSLAAAVQHFIENPSQLTALRTGTKLESHFSLHCLSTRLKEILAKI